MWAAAGVGEHWALCQCSLGSSPPAPASRQGLTPTRMLWRKRSQGLGPPLEMPGPQEPPPWGDKALFPMGFCSACSPSLRGGRG